MSGAARGPEGGARAADGPLATAADGADAPLAVAAIDLGATSGRVMLGVVDHGRISYDGPLAGGERIAPAGDQHHAHGPDRTDGAGYRLDQPQVTRTAPDREGDR